MVQSRAATPEAYLSELPEERREVLERVRAVILDNLPEGYRETMNWGMIAYEVPLERYPGTYNGQPLLYMALAAQKNHYAVYTSGVYMDPGGPDWIRREFEKAGMKLDIGKSCIRFRNLEQLPLDVIGKISRGQSVDRFIEVYEAGLKRR